MAPNSGSPSHPARWTAAIVLGLVVLAALPFLIAGTGDFVNIDDNDYVLENRALRSGLSAASLRWALTTFHASNWHPLTWLSHLTDVSLFGLDPRGHHLSSVALHALGTGLLFMALARLTGARVLSAFVAAVFGLHPLRVESVAWISERKDVLSGVCFMLLLLAYERYVRCGGARRYLPVVVLFALGLAAKPMLVTAPLVLLLLDYWPLGRLRLGRGESKNWVSWRTPLTEKLPLLALSVASGLITFSAQRAGGAISTLEFIAPALRLANALLSYAAYLGKAVWPAGLAAYYPYPIGGISAAKIAGASLLIAATSIVVISSRRTRPYLAVGWFWYLVTLLPVIGIVQVGGQAMADRYTYLPLIGPLLAVTWLATDLARSRGTTTVITTAVVGIVVIVSLAVLTTRQANFWRNSEILFRRALDVTGDNWLAHNNLATFLLKRDRPDEAIEHLNEVVRIAPWYRAEAYSNIGKALFELGRPEEAVVRFRQALHLRENFPNAHFNLGLALAALQRQAEAETEYRAAIRLDLDFPAAHTDLGRLLASLGRRAEAEENYRQAIRLDPEFVAAHTNLGVLLAREGRFQEAETSLREASRLHPEIAEPRSNLGFVLMSLGRHSEAEVAYRDALRRAPDLFPALAGLGRVLNAQGRREEAATLYREALRLNPRAEEIRRELESLTSR